MKNYDSNQDYLKVIDQFNSLDIDQKLSIFGNLPPQAREDLIGLVARPGEIIRRVSEEEMFFTIKDLGEENAERLVAMTTGRQLMYLLDIDLWTQKGLNVVSVTRWFQIIVGIGEEKVLQLVQVSDPELLCSLLNKAVFVKMKDPDIDLTEQLDFLPPFTLDNTFFVDFRIPLIEDCVKEFLDCIFRYDSAYYMKLMQSLASGWLPEFEDSAYRWRSARLADHGFPDFDEALEIYSLFNPALIRTSNTESGPVDETPGVDTKKLLTYPTVVLNGKNLFEKTVAGINNHEIRDRIASEIAHVANRIMVADCLDPGSISALKATLEKTGGYINLGLEEVLSREPVSAQTVLEANHMEYLFRHGYTLIMQLQYEGRRFLKDCEGGLENLGLPLAPLMSGLLLKRPVFDPGAAESSSRREFQFLSDLELIRNVMKANRDGVNWEVL